MTTPALGLTEAEAEQRDALVGRLFQSALGMGDILTVYLGDRLGIYRALADGGPATSHQLAGRTNTHERYVREWLEQQAVTGILTASDDFTGMENQEAILRISEHLEDVRKGAFPGEEHVYRMAEGEAEKLAGE